MLPFALDFGGVVDPEPVRVLEAGAAFVVADAAARAAPRPPLLTVAWTEDDVGEAGIGHDLVRGVDRPGSVLIDLEPVALAAGPAARTLVVHPHDDPPTAAEQWRLAAGGRRWTVSALTALADQPAWGPRLAAVATTFRPA